MRIKGSPASAGIDPVWVLADGASHRLPRIRGDRPVQVVRRHGRLRAPPHPRGSTPPGARLPRCPPGSPASAGIDPSRPPRRRPRPRLPRIRGDRPRHACLCRLSKWAPPHPRGSTPVRSCRHAGWVGSPASAGIDPGSATLISYRSWLPRIRGDRPPFHAGTIREFSAPPHPRGSTVHALPRSRLYMGSPASAGIDPGQGRHYDAGRWLPRIRGDRPIISGVGANLNAAPPHPRGSTPPRHRRPGPDSGSPASAGIDPRHHRRAACGARLPRIRGDRPMARRSASSDWPAPPHPRGSTQRMMVNSARRGGSPASAGIDPSARCPDRAGTRLPRIRGDRPCALRSATAA